MTVNSDPVKDRLVEHCIDLDSDFLWDENPRVRTWQLSIPPCPRIGPSTGLYGRVGRLAAADKLQEGSMLPSFNSIAIVGVFVLDQISRIIRARSRRRTRMRVHMWYLRRIAPRAIFDQRNGRNREKNHCREFHDRPHASSSSRVKC